MIDFHLTANDAKWLSPRRNMAKGISPVLKCAKRNKQSVKTNFLYLKDLMN